MFMTLLCAIYMLRGNIVVFGGPGRGAQIANLALNMLICVTVFLISLWMVDVFVAYQDR